jgi:hypothetical protein
LVAMKDLDASHFRKQSLLLQIFRKGRNTPMNSREILSRRYDRSNGSDMYCEEIEVWQPFFRSLGTRFAETKPVFSYQMIALGGTL